MKEVIAAHVLSGSEIGGLAELEGSGFDLLKEGNLAYEIGQIADEAAREAAEAAFEEVVQSLEGATIEQIEQATGSARTAATSLICSCREAGVRRQQSTGSPKPASPAPEGYQPRPRRLYDPHVRM